MPPTILVVWLTTQYAVYNAIGPVGDQDSGGLSGSTGYMDLGATSKYI